MAESLIGVGECLGFLLAPLNLLAFTINAAVSNHAQVAQVGELAFAALQCPLSFDVGVLEEAEALCEAHIAKRELGDASKSWFCLKSSKALIIHHDGSCKDREHNVEPEEEAKSAKP